MRNETEEITTDPMAIKRIITGYNEQHYPHKVNNLEG